MADQEHFKRIQQGVRSWNQWRRENKKYERQWVDLIKPDLSGAALDGMNLAGIDLSHADLSGAHLVGANAVRSNLSDADLTNADLRNANLQGANLRGAYLRGAYVRGAHLGESHMAGTVFLNVDISGVQGLESVTHQGPSEISVSTIYRSKGNIPEVFLRGAGIPENLIVYMRSLVGKTFDFYSCFISYSSKDHQFAERLHADLQARGVRCWFAPEDLKIGDELRRSFDNAIRIHDKLMVILSQNSVKSPWVEDEVETAFEKERREGRTVLFPIRLDDSVMATGQPWAAKIKRARHIGDFCDWKNHDSYAKAFDRLLRDLRAEDKLNLQRKADARR